MLQPHVQRGTTCGQHFHAGTLAQQLRHIRCSRQNVLEIIQNQEKHLPIPQIIEQQIADDGSASLFETKRISDGKEDKRGITDRTKIDKYHSIVERATESAAERDRESRLATAARPCQRQQPHIAFE
jgi:hypothetical protein